MVYPEEKTAEKEGKICRMIIFQTMIHFGMSNI